MSSKSVIYYSTHTRKNVIYLLNIYIEINCDYWVQGGLEFHIGTFVILEQLACSTVYTVQTTVAIM